MTKVRIDRVLFIVVSILVSHVCIAEEKDLGSLGFGLGIGLTWLDDSDVRNTEVKGGLVRITDEEKQKRSFWLETHYLLDRYKCGDYCSHGPFLAAQLSGDNSILSALAIGYMLSMKRTPIADKSNNSAFNIGIGYVSTKSQKLGDGFTENAALPTGEESVRYRQFDNNGILLLFSFSFYSVPGTQALK